MPEVSIQVSFWPLIKIKGVFEAYLYNFGTIFFERNGEQWRQERIGALR
jgi:hypothetical protein